METQKCKNAKKIESSVKIKKENYRAKQCWQCDLEKRSNSVAQTACSTKTSSPTFISWLVFVKRPSRSFWSNITDLFSFVGDIVVFGSDLLAPFVFFSISTCCGNILIMICASFSNFPRFSIGNFELSKCVTVSLEDGNFDGFYYSIFQKMNFYFDISERTTEIFIDLFAIYAQVMCLFRFLGSLTYQSRHKCEWIRLNSPPKTLSTPT